MIKVTNRGSFSRSLDFLNRMKRREEFRPLAKYGPMGVAALREATPKDSSDTANGWYFEIVDRPGYFAIHWLNSNLQGQIPVAVLIQYGHATGNGGYVQGQDYINPTMRTIFDQIAADMWREVTR